MLVVLIGVALSFILEISFIQIIASSVSDYGHYIDRGKVDELQSILRITKYLYIPLVLWGIYKLPKMNLCRTQSQFFVIGTMAFAIKISVVSLDVVERIGRYLEIFSILPIVFLLIYYKKGKRMECFLCVLLYLIIPYAVKVIMSQSGGYYYDSFLCH